MEGLCFFFLLSIGNFLLLFLAKRHDFLHLGNVIATKFNFLNKIFIETVWDVDAYSWNPVIVCIA